MTERSAALPDPALASSRPERRTVRVSAAQMQAQPAANLDALLGRVDYFVGVAAGYRSDFVVFPELFSLALLAGMPERIGAEAAMARLAEETPELIARISEIAARRRVNVIAGSHPTRVAVEGGAVQIRNVAYACLRDGAVKTQDKLHPTPDEREIWGVCGGDALDAFETDCGRVAMLVCYDVEFPELARRVADAGALILFVPYATDTRQGHLRVRLCAQARTIENQIFVVAAGNVGHLPNVDNMDINYAQSAVFTPCDFEFARDGVAAEASENVEMLITADLDLGALARARVEGSVRNFRDRRSDLYEVRWRGR